MTRARAADVEREPDAGATDPRRHDVDDAQAHDDARPSWAPLKERGLQSEVGGHDALAATLRSGKHLHDLEFAERLCATTHDSATGLMGSLVPQYLAARDALDTELVGQLGTKLIGSLTLVHAAKELLDETFASLPRQSVLGMSAEQDVDAMQRQEQVRARALILASLSAAADAAAAAAMTPQRFRGRQVAGVGAAVALGANPELVLAGEHARTLEMLMLVSSLTAKLERPDAQTADTLDEARKQLRVFKSRPLDLAFLKLALDDIWDLLEATHDGHGPSPDRIMEKATEQAGKTGWLGDVGGWDTGLAMAYARSVTKGGSQKVYEMLMSASDDARPRLLVQIRDANLLDQLFLQMPWAQIKALHDSLPTGHFANIKDDLQRYWRTEDRWGTDLEHQDEHKSLNRMVEDWAEDSVLGTIVDVTLDFGTFGFNEAYGNAYDLHAQGLITDGDYHTAVTHAALKSAAVAAVAMATGGAADKFVRGGAAGATVVRGALAGGAGGSVGSVAGLATSDTYDVHVSGDKDEYSSAKDYVKTALIGGAIGAGFGAGGQALAKGSIRN